MEINLNSCVLMHNTNKFVFRAKFFFQNGEYRSKRRVGHYKDTQKSAKSQKWKLWMMAVRSLKG
jgi:hypothetical protein